MQCCATWIGPHLRCDDRQGTIAQPNEQCDDCDRILSLQHRPVIGQQLGISEGKWVTHSWLQLSEAELKQLLQHCNSN